MIKIKIPLLNIDTVAKDKADIAVAIDEAIESFIIASEKFGKGLKQELISCIIEGNAVTMEE